ncbi:RecF/RecN/SMC [Gongronella butleri]|nr:RecF/RecN/SMC [Gongronella butleri]
MSRLLHIELDNFKSYKGRHVIGPFNDFTCIMGPNGSGKSNLMDAISFVLGVDSVHLRSNSVKDLLYRPMAQEMSSTRVDTASVAAVLETADGDQVTFKRTARNDGSSVYTLNGTRASYADYNERLEELGIMAKAMNFLVFQGEIEDVASRDPMKLTKLIERISGSLAHKERYEELKASYDRAVDETAHALQLKRSVTIEARQYRQQKDQVDKYNDLLRQYKEMQARFLLWELYHVEDAAKQKEAQAAELQLSNSDAAKERNDLELQFQTVRKEQAIAHRDRVRAEAEIKKINEELTDMARTKKSLETKAQHAEAKIDQITTTGQLVERDLGQQELEVKKFVNDLEMAKQEEAQNREKKKRKRVLKCFWSFFHYFRKQRVTMVAIKEQEQMVSLQQQRKLAAQKHEQEKDKLSVLETAAKQYKKTRQQVVDNGQALTAEQERLSTRLLTRSAQLQELEQERVKIEQREQEINKQLQEILDQLLEANMQQQETSKNKQLEDALTMMKQLFPGVRGQLSKLCKPTQRKYGAAVRTVLGRNMDAFVVDDQQTAIDCIRYLREQCIGTATFLPLDSLTAPTINDRLRNLPRSRLAVDVIQCDRLYQPAINYACENTVICDNMAVAKRVCFEMNEDVKAVTLEGSIIHRSGLMTGGPGSGENVRDWDDNDVEGLCRTRDKLLAELNDLSRNKRMAITEENAKHDCEALQKQLNMLADDIQALRDTDASTTQNEALLTACKAKVDELAQSVAQFDAQVAQVASSLATVEDEVFGDFCAAIGVATIREYEDVALKLPEQAREKKKAFRLQQSRLEAQLAFEQQQYQDLQERLASLIAQREAAHASINDYQREAADTDQRVEKQNKRLAEAEAKLTQHRAIEHEKQQEIQALRQQLEAMGADAAKYLKDLDKIELAIEKLNSDRTAIFRKCKLEEIEFPLLRGSMDDVLTEAASSISNGGGETSMSMSMDVDAEPSTYSIHSSDWVVEVDYTVLDDDERANSSLTMRKRYQDDLVRRKKEMAVLEPNLKSIDRLDTVERDVEQMDEKYRTARRNLDTIKEQFNQVKRQRHQLFTDAFTHISERIDSVYKELTSSALFPAGGKAYLTLENSEEPYLRGVLYHAMPPMKRFQDMTQLSGGEKSMAALALVFAIRSYQQSPFFVMDEVDAALDNTNVKQLADYLKRHASSTLQFIMISFKTMLYEHGDSLVGVYRLQDSNCSGTPLTLKVKKKKTTMLANDTQIVCADVVFFSAFFLFLSFSWMTMKHSALSLILFVSNHLALIMHFLLLEK